MRRIVMAPVLLLGNRISRRGRNAVARGRGGGGVKRSITMLLVAATVIVVLACAGAAAGATWVVDDGGGADFASIQAAVNAASEGDMIEVASGTYIENVNIATAHLTLTGDGAGVVTVTAAISSDHVLNLNMLDTVMPSASTP